MASGINGVGSFIKSLTFTKTDSLHKAAKQKNSSEIKKLKSELKAAKQSTSQLIDSKSNPLMRAKNTISPNTLLALQNRLNKLVSVGVKADSKTIKNMQTNLNKAYQNLKTHEFKEGRYRVTSSPQFQRAEHERKIQQQEQKQQDIKSGEHYQGGMVK